MLPIVKRKTLEVPHGLAAVAAAICLVLAFATDFSDRDQHSAASIDKSAPVDFVAKQGAVGGEDREATTDASHGHGVDTAPAGASALINWFGLRR